MLVDVRRFDSRPAELVVDDLAVADTHAVVKREPLADQTAGATSAFAPVLTVVLFQHAGGTKVVDAALKPGLVEVRRVVLIQHGEPPNLGLLRAFGHAHAQLVVGEPHVGEDVWVAALQDADWAQGVLGRLLLAPFVVIDASLAAAQLALVVVAQSAADDVAVLTEKNLLRTAERGGELLRELGKAGHRLRGMGDLRVVEVPDIVDCELPVTGNRVLLNAGSNHHVATFGQQHEADTADVTQVLI